VWFGKLISEEGFTLAYGNKTITYADARGAFQFGLEDGKLFPSPYQISGDPLQLSPSELSEIVERIVRGIKSEGNNVEVFSKQDSGLTK